MALAELLVTLKRALVAVYFEDDRALGLLLDDLRGSARADPGEFDALIACLTFEIEYYTQDPEDEMEF